MQTKNKKRLGLAGLVLGGALSLLSPAYAQDKEKVEIESENTSSEIIATFQYDSHRAGYEGKSPFLTYNIWSDNTISREGSDARFAPIWFWDVDGDGEFGDAEIEAMKSGKLVYMHPAFNKIANRKLRRAMRKAFGYHKPSDFKYEKIPEEVSLEPPKVQEHEVPLAESLPETAEEEEKTEKVVLPETAEEEEKTEKVVLPETALPEYTEKERKTKSTPVSLIFGANSNAKFDSFGGTFGVRVNPFKNKKIGLGALMDVGGALDKQIDTYSRTFSNGRTFYGELNDKDIFSIGGSLEFQYGPLFFGGGIDSERFIREVIEQIRSVNGNVLKSNTNSVSDRQVFGKIYGGGGIPIGKRKNLRIEGLLGYDASEGFYYGIRSSARLNPNKE